LNEEIPTRLGGVIHDRHRRRRSHQARAAAAVLVLVGAGAIGWIGGQYADNDTREVTRYIAAAEIAYQADRPTPVSLTRAPAGLVGTPTKPLQWLSDRVTFELRTPDLSQEGYQPAGNALVEINGRPTAQLTYRNADGERLNLYLRSRWSETQPGFNTAARGETRSVHWFDGPVMWVLVGDAEPGKLRRLAERVHSEMRLEPSADSLPNDPSVVGPTTIQDVTDATRPQQIPTWP
jgi:anti-sigma factor RsiW